MERTSSTMDDQVKDLHAQGLNLRQIVRKLDSDTATIGLVFRRLGLKQSRIRSVKPEELEEMVSLAKEGHSGRQIAKIMHMSSSVVLRELAPYGLIRPKALTEDEKERRLATILSMHEQEIPPRTVAAHLGISKNQYGAYASSLGIGRVVSKIDDAEVLRLSNEGMSVEDIAKKLGTTVHRVEVAISNDPNTDGSRHGVLSGMMVASGCECELCGEAREIMNAKVRESNAETAKTARNKGQEWTGPELEIIVRTDLTSKQKAIMIGRTIASVNMAIAKLRNEPTWKAAIRPTPPPSQRKILPRHIKIMTDRSITVKEAARQVGCSVWTVQRYRSLAKLEHESAAR